MARCGCSSTSTCNCFVTAGPNVTVTGSGTAGNPFVVSSDGNALEVEDSSTVDHTLSGTGTTGDPYVLTSVVKVDPAAGNLIEVTPNGIRVDCDGIAAECGSQVITVDDTDTVDLTLAGDVLTADVILDPDDNLITAGPAGLLVSCDNVRTCLTAGDGVAYDPNTGQFSACLSTDAGNVLALGADNCLYVPSGAASVATDCGLLGDGSDGDPLRLAVQGGVWPYPCDQNAEGGALYCNPNSGALHGEPEKFSSVVANNGGTFPGVTNVPNVDTVVDTATINLTNPSSCHAAVALVVWEADVTFLTAGNTQLDARMNGDGMVQFQQTGGTVDQIAFQQARGQIFNLAPGQVLAVALPIAIRENVGGGSTYNRTQWRIQAHITNV